MVDVSVRGAETGSLAAIGPAAPASSHVNPYLELVDRLRIPAARYEAARNLSAGGRGARENRRKDTFALEIEPLIWGLSHQSPMVRRCCLELLDQHADPRATPHIVGRLDAPVPRVRWRAVARTALRQALAEGDAA